ncbi:MAG: hypothetical protein AAFX86_04745 [Pseudomonadota bacterium]
MKDMLFGIEMLAFYGIILGFAFWELWKVSKLTDNKKTPAPEENETPDE